VNDDRPKLLGVFPSQFPPWGRDGHEHNGRPCEMGAFTGSLCYSHRFMPVGVSAVDVNGQLWVLVRDWTIRESEKGHVWVRFPVEFVR